MLYTISLLSNFRNFVSGISASGGSTGDLSAILSAATQLVTWLISTIGDFLTFIVANPVILVLFLMMIVSFAVGVLFRIWRSTGV